MNHNSYIRKVAISLIITIISILFLDDSIESAIIAGGLALFFNTITIYEVRGNKYLAVLFSVILYINASAYVLGVLTRGLTFNQYQWELWSSKYNSIGMKGILITSCIFYIVMLRSSLNNNYQLHKPNIRNQNYIISIICLIISVLSCLFGFNGSAEDGEYQSNNSPIFEYAVLFYVLAWAYGNQNKILVRYWYVCSILYIFIALLAGDRSSSFMLLFVIALNNINKLSLKRIFLFGFLGIMLANFIGQYRIGGIGGSIILDLASRGLKTLFMDTAAQSYYTSLTIYEYNETISNQLQLFGGWVISLFSGGLFIDRESINLAYLASMYDHNGGGGLFQPYFYLFGRFVGIIIGSLLVAYIIKNVYWKWNNDYSNLLKVIIPAMSLRWYLYSPTTFFRTCIINFFFLYIIINICGRMIYSANKSNNT